MPFIIHGKLAFPLSSYVILSQEEKPILDPFVLPYDIQNLKVTVFFCPLMSFCDILNS